MSDEQPKNVTSVPPPTDEIDQDWGGTPPPPGTGTKSNPSASDAKPVKASDSKSSSATSKPKSKPEEDEEEDDEEEDDEEEDDEEEDDGEEDEEEDDEEEDDDHASSAKSPEAVRRAAARPADSNDWIPDWGPWAVLVILVVFGIVGGLGFVSTPTLQRAAPAEGEAKSAAAHEEVKPKVAAAAPAAAPGTGEEESVEASHLLVAYQGAMRAAPTTTRTKDEAKARAAEALAKAKKGASFEKLVAEYSDEPNAAARGGKLGAFTRNRMVKPFADAAFALKPGQLSGVVETAFGYHVILRTK